MRTRELDIVDGASTGSWIASRLGTTISRVTDVVPRGYKTYARVFHPATDTQWNPVKWADVAELLGTVVHREMQWHAILGLSKPEELQSAYGDDTAIGAKWMGNDPPIGGMDIATLDALCEILTTYMADPSRCYFGLCTIEDWLAQFSDDELKPLLRLPLDRDYVVLSGPLCAVDQITRGHTSADPGSALLATRYGEGPPLKHEKHGWKRREAPNLIWPADHSWFVSSEVDFDSTLVGGHPDLIKAIVDSPDLEAWQVEPTDSLAADADKVNRPSAPL